MALSTDGQGPWRDGDGEEMPFSSTGELPAAAAGHDTLMDTLLQGGLRHGSDYGGGIFHQAVNRASAGRLSQPMSVHGACAVGDSLGVDDVLNLDDGDESDNSDLEQQQPEDGGEEGSRGPVRCGMVASAVGNELLHTDMFLNRQGEQQQPLRLQPPPQQQQQQQLSSHCHIDDIREHPPLQAHGNASGRGDPQQTTYSARSFRVADEVVSKQSRLSAGSGRSLLLQYQATRNSVVPATSRPASRAARAGGAEQQQQPLSSGTKGQPGGGLGPDMQAACGKGAAKLYDWHLKAKLLLRVFAEIVRRKPWVLVAPLVLCGLLCCLAVFGVVYAAERDVRNQKAYALEAVASTTASAIAGQLELATFAVMAMSAYLTQQPYCKSLDTNFHNLSQSILAWNEKEVVYQLQALPAALLNYIYPPVEGDLAKLLYGRDLLQVPQYRNDTLFQISHRKMLMLGPYNLLEGFQGMFVTMPVFLPAPNSTFDWGCDAQPYECPPGLCWVPSRGERLWGLVTSVISLDNLQVDFRFEGLTSQGYHYRLRQLPDIVNQAAVIAESPLPPLNPVTVTISKYNLYWALEVSPAAGWRPPWRNPCIGAVVLGSLVVAALVLWLLVTQEKHNNLLQAMLPRKIIERLQRGEQTVVEEFLDPVTILFSDIVSYTEVASQLSPLEVVRLLNELYTQFDRLCDKHGVYKVETIGDAFMCVSGCPIREDPVKAAVRMAEMAQDMIAMVEKFVTKVGNEEMGVKIRIGLHSGPVVAGVIGQRMPRYCLFGDTVNTASRMETNSQPMCIHISAATASLLRKAGASIIMPTATGTSRAAAVRRLGSSVAASSCGVGSGGGGGGGQASPVNLSFFLDQHDRMSPGLPSMVPAYGSAVASAGNTGEQRNVPSLQGTGDRDKRDTTTAAAAVAAVLQTPAGAAAAVAAPMPGASGATAMGAAGAAAGAPAAYGKASKGSALPVLYGRGKVLIKGKGMMHTFWIGAPPPTPPQLQPPQMQSEHHHHQQQKQLTPPSLASTQPHRISQSQQAPGSRVKPPSPIRMYECRTSIAGGPAAAANATATAAAGTGTAATTTDPSPALDAPSAEYVDTYPLAQQASISLSLGCRPDRVAAGQTVSGAQRAAQENGTAWVTAPTMPYGAAGLAAGAAAGGFRGAAGGNGGGAEGNVRSEESDLLMGSRAAWLLADDVDTAAAAALPAAADSTGSRLLVDHGHDAAQTQGQEDDGRLVCDGSGKAESAGALATAANGIAHSAPLSLGVPTAIGLSGIAGGGGGGGGATSLDLECSFRARDFILPYEHQVDRGGGRSRTVSRGQLTFSLGQFTFVSPAAGAAHGVSGGLQPSAPPLSVSASRMFVNRSAADTAAAALKSEGAWSQSAERPKLPPSGPPSKEDAAAATTAAAAVVTAMVSPNEKASGSAAATAAAAAATVSGDFSSSAADVAVQLYDTVPPDSWMPPAAGAHSPRAAARFEN